MAKKAKDIKCKKCSNSFPIGSDEDKETRNKEWTMVAPMPDKDGNVTITLMATWSCSNCGYTIRGSAGKTKGKFEGKSKKERLDEIVNSWEEVNIADFAETLGVDPANIEKVLAMYIKKGKAAATIKNGVFVPDVDREVIDEIIDSGDELVFADLAKSVNIATPKVQEIIKVLIDQKQVYGDLQKNKLIRDVLAEDLITETLVGEKFELEKIAKRQKTSESEVEKKLDQLMSEKVIFGQVEENKGTKLFNPH